jgi:hypothetical protein
MKKFICNTTKKRQIKTRENETHVDVLVKYRYVTSPTTIILSKHMLRVLMTARALLAGA